MPEKLRISKPTLALLAVLAFTMLTGTAVGAAVVPLAKKALFANNAGKLQGKTAAQVAAIPGPATDSPTLAGQTPAQLAATPGPASTAAGLLAYRTASGTLAPDAAGSLTASCAAGERATGGGSSSPNFVLGLDSYPVNDGAAWRVFVANGSSSQSASVTAYAVCMK